MNRLWLPILLVSCNGAAEPCTPNTTRCSPEDIAQVCDSDNEWQDVVDCRTLGGRWYCTQFDGGLHSCETDGG